MSGEPSRNDVILIFSPDPSVRRDLAVQARHAAGSEALLLEAETGARACDLAAAHRPAIASLDLRENPDEVLRLLPVILESSPETRAVGLFSPLSLPPGWEVQELLLRGLRAGFQDYLRLPVSPDEVRQVFARLVEHGRKSPSENGSAPQGKVVSFMSAKGGVGKTTLTVNVAVLLARRFPGEVALVDASLETGSVADFLDLKPERTLADALRERDRLDRDLLRSLMARHEESGLWILPSPKTLEEAVEVTPDGMTALLLALRAGFRWVLADTYPVFNALVLAVGDLSDRIVAVTEAIVPSIRATRELLIRLREAGYPAERLRVALNAYARFQGNVDPDLVAEALERPIDWVLPYDKAAHTAVNLGRPFVLEKPRSPLSVKIATLADELAGHAAERRLPFWRRLGRREPAS